MVMRVGCTVDPLISELKRGKGDPEKLIVHYCRGIFPGCERIKKNSIKAHENAALAHMTKSIIALGFSQIFVIIKSCLV